MSNKPKIKTPDRLKPDTATTIMSNKPKIKNSRPLKLSDFDNFTKYGYSGTLDNLALGDYEFDEDLYDSDYIIGKITICGTKYRIIHGFPGDNPLGAIFNKDVTYLIGECVDMDMEADPVLWYMKKTDELSNYDDVGWYCRKIEDTTPTPNSRIEFSTAPKK